MNCIHPTFQYRACCVYTDCFSAPGCPDGPDIPVVNCSHQPSIRADLSDLLPALDLALCMVCILTRDAFHGLKHIFLSTKAETQRSDCIIGSGTPTILLMLTLLLEGC